MEFDGISWYFMVFHGISWYFAVFRGISPFSDTVYFSTFQKYDPPQCADAHDYLFLQGPVVRKCYYSLVTMLDSLYDRPALLEHTGEVSAHETKVVKRVKFFLL